MYVEPSERSVACARSRGQRGFCPCSIHVGRDHPPSSEIGLPFVINVEASQRETSRVVTWLHSGAQLMAFVDAINLNSMSCSSVSVDGKYLEIMLEEPALTTRMLRMRSRCGYASTSSARVGMERGHSARCHSDRAESACEVSTMAPAPSTTPRAIGLGNKRGCWPACCRPRDWERRGSAAVRRPSDRCP